MSKMPHWPPRDWRAAMALALSAGGAVALTVLLWLMAGMLLPEKGWSEGSEGERVTTIRWALWICALCILLVLTGLGFSASRRGLRLERGDNKLEWEGGEDFAPRQENDDVRETDQGAGDESGAADRTGRGEASGAPGG